MECKHKIHSYCIGRRCKYAEPIEHSGVCILSEIDKLEKEQQNGTKKL